MTTSKQQAEKYEWYGIICGIVGLLLFFPIGILGIYYGAKAKELDPSKGNSAIFAGIFGLVVGLIFSCLLVGLLL